jgi:hypothetical protein
MGLADRMRTYDTITLLINDLQCLHLSWLTKDKLPMITLRSIARTSIYVVPSIVVASQ